MQYEALPRRDPTVRVKRLSFEIPAREPRDTHHGAGGLFSFLARVRLT
ncbi:hypothetical protein KCP69_25665 [Salmonella enterica subsp. enterica]|nr:hypothetical protein KCP69_25665 [Salmonella enterica subsp. enterica]